MYNVRSGNNQCTILVDCVDQAIAHNYWQYTIVKRKEKKKKKETEAAAKTIIKASARVKRLNKYQKSQSQTWQLCRGTQLVQRLLKLIPHELHHCVLSMESQCIRITSLPAKSPLP